MEREAAIIRLERLAAEVQLSILRRQNLLYWQDPENRRFFYQSPRPSPDKKGRA